MTEKCSWTETQMGADRKCGGWASHEVDGKPYCRHHPTKPEGRAGKKRDLTLLESVVWDALKNSRCPHQHRYKSPGGSLPCRWCRTAHAMILILRRMELDGISPEVMVRRMEDEVGWTMRDPVIEAGGKGDPC